MSDDDYQKLLNEPSDPREERFQKFIPDYANDFLESYVAFDQKKAGDFSYRVLGIFNYLEVDFEVDMDQLETVSDRIGIVSFSTGNFPYGGMERFIMTLKAFDLQPIECYNGFDVFDFDWKTDFVFEDIQRPEKTKEYLAKYKK